MKKTSLFFISLIAFTISLHAQYGNGKKIKGNGEKISKQRNTDVYDQIKVKGSLDVSLFAGKEGELQLVGESNLIDYIVTEVSDGTLKIYVQRGVYLSPSSGKSLIVKVPFKDLDNVTLSGSGSITSSDTIESSEFKTGVSWDKIQHEPVPNKLSCKFLLERFGTIT